MSPRFTSVERAQLLLEILSRSDRKTYAAPLKRIRQLSRTPIVLEKTGVADVIASLPTEPVRLLVELRDHLGSMQVGADASLYQSIDGLLKSLPQPLKSEPSSSKL